VLHGCFMEYFFGPFLHLYDPKEKTLTYWGDPDSLFDLTTINDSAR